MILKNCINYEGSQLERVLVWEARFGKVSADVKCVSMYKGQSSFQLESISCASCKRALAPLNYAEQGYRGKGVGLWKGNLETGIVVLNPEGSSERR